MKRMVDRLLLLPLTPRLLVVRLSVLKYVLGEIGEIFLFRVVGQTLFWLRQLWLKR